MNYRCWNESEIASFDGKQRDLLLQAGIAELVKEAPVQKSAGKKTVAPPPPPPPVELAEEEETPEAAPVRKKRRRRRSNPA